MHCDEPTVVRPVVHSIIHMSPELQVLTVVFDRLAVPALDTQCEHKSGLTHVKGIVHEDADLLLLVYCRISMFNHVLKLYRSVYEDNYGAQKREASSDLRLCLLMAIDVVSWPLLSEKVNPS